MKKFITSSLSLLSAIVLLTACSNESIAEMLETTNPVVGTVAEDEIPSEPNLRSSSVNENLESLKAELPIESFTGLNGETLSVYSAIDIVEPDPDTNSYGYGIVYDYAYITYAASVYDMELFDPDKTTTIFTTILDTDELVKRYNKYIENKSVIYTVKKGDKLENGLVCTGAETCYIIYENGETAFSHTSSCFSGELTLTGTITVTGNESVPGERYLYFVADKDNGNIIGQYELSLPDVVDLSEDQIYFVNEIFGIGYISDLSEEYASLINDNITDNRYVNVEVTLKDFYVKYTETATGYPPSATLVDLKVL